MSEEFSKNTDLSAYIDSFLKNTLLSEVCDEELNKLELYMTQLNNRAIDLSTSKRTKAHWETGWDQNYVKLTSRTLDYEEAVVPAYFTKQKYFRYKNKIYNLITWELLQKVHIACLNFVAKKASQFYKHEFIIEVGSGSGQNVLELSKLFPKSIIIGADWSDSSRKITDHLGEIFTAEGRDKSFKVRSEFFDFFHPETLDVKNKVLYTIHSLEQVGKDLTFLNFLLTSEVGLVVSIEPILEHYSRESALGRELIELHILKEYLVGYPSWLKENASLGLLEILYEARIDFGTLTAEPYSVFIWRPISIV
jgi:hypothetical protein